MLLAHDIPDKDLQWFLDKGILVKKCKPLFDGHFKVDNLKSQVLLSKFYLFTFEFKKWKDVVFLDADMIVRKSLGNLIGFAGFAAGEAEYLAEEFDFTEESDVREKLSKKYNLNKKAFNSGVMVFNTDIIGEDSFDILMKLFNEYFSVQRYNEETILNLFFYDKWQKISFIYNYNPFSSPDFIFNPDSARLSKRKTKLICGLPAAVFHFYGNFYKPWKPESIFYKEWKGNLYKSDGINLNDRINAKELTEMEVQKYSKDIKKRMIASYKTMKIYRTIGKVGIFLKNRYPKIYFFIKNFQPGSEK